MVWPIVAWFPKGQGLKKIIWNTEKVLKQETIVCFDILSLKLMKIPATAFFNQVGFFVCFSGFCFLSGTYWGKVIAWILTSEFSLIFQVWEKKSRHFSFWDALFKRSWQERVFLKPETFMFFVIKGCQTCVSEDLGNLFLSFRSCGLTPGSTRYSAVAYLPSCLCERSILWVNISTAE